MIKQQQLAKQTENYKAAERKEASKFEQKPLLKFNEFNDEEENEIKECDVNKTKNAKHKFLMRKDWRKFQKNPENNKEKEKVMWERLDEFKKKFKDIKKHKGAEKEMSTRIVYSKLDVFQSQQRYLSIFVGSGQVW